VNPVPITQPYQQQDMAGDIFKNKAPANQFQQQKINQKPDLFADLNMLGR
jgi:hypothetical protein